MQKYKLLHIALGNHNKAMYRAFENHFNTKHYDWTKNRKDTDVINTDIIKIQKSFKPDFIFMQIQNDGIITKRTAKEISKNSFVINWTGDVRVPILDFFYELAEFIDLTLFTNITDVKIMRENGYDADYLQVGFDPDLYSPFYKKKATPDIIFLANNYGNKFPLSNLRAKIVSKLKETFPHRFNVYGNDWNSFGINTVSLKPEEEAIAYNSSKIAINCSHFDYERYSSDRLPRIMGSGGFALSHHFKGIENDYEINKHLVTWNNIEDMIDKCKFYLNNHYIRERIRCDGCYYIRQTGTWNHRIIELKKILGI